MSAYDTGIVMTNGFSIAAQKPADLKYLADTLDDRDSYVTKNVSYEGMLVYVNQTKKVYQLIDNKWNEFGFNAEQFEANIYDGLNSDSTKLALSAKQGKILNTNINTHITDTDIHITADERTTWNAKASTAVATQTANGLMSASDKKRLDGIATNANNYVHPDTHPATMIVEDSTHRFVSDTEKAAWNAKASTAVASTTANGLMSSTDKTKLDGIVANANNYVHPSTHPASIIVQDANNRFVTDTEKATWNAKAGTAVATTTANGLMSSAMVTKLNGIAEGANKYTHPTTHPASIIVQDANNRFVTDEQINYWNSKPGSAEELPVVTTTANGLMSFTDKINLDSLISRMETLEIQQAQMLAKLKTAVFYE